VKVPSGTGLPGYSRTKGHKTVVVLLVVVGLSHIKRTFREIWSMFFWFLRVKYLS